MLSCPCLTDKWPSVFWNTYGGNGLSWSNLRKNRLVEQKPKVVAVEVVAVAVL